MRILQTVTAVAPGIQASFLATGGTPPYIYSVMANGAGGTIDASTGIYVAPAQMSENVEQTFDTILSIDSLGDRAKAIIMVGTPLLLLCDIIQNQMGLKRGRVYLWDQKILQPTDNGLYVAVSMMTCKAFGNNINYISLGPNPGDGMGTVQESNIMAVVDIDIISRGPAARDQKELVLMALNSNYSEQQQEANGFHISRLPSGSRFINLSNIDGAAIPYRYKISMAMQYAVTNQKSVDYFTDFSQAVPPEVVVDA